MRNFYAFSEYMKALIVTSSAIDKMFEIFGPIFEQNVTMYKFRTYFRTKCKFRTYFQTKCKFRTYLILIKKSLFKRKALDGCLKHVD